jgi:O-antigen/teichoic acid export membrane protein
MLAKERIKYILSLSLVKDSLKLSSSSILLFVIPLFVTPILSRIYTPEDYGEWGIFSSVYLIVNYLLFLSYDNAIIKTNDIKNIPNLCVLCALVALGVIFIIFLLFFLGQAFNILFFIKYPRFDMLIVMLSVGILQNLTIALANRFMCYGVMSISNIVNGISQASFRLLFGIILIVSSGIIIGAVVANFIASLVLIIGLRKILSTLDWRNVSFSGIKKMAILYKKFPLYDAPSNLLNFSSAQLAIIILAFFYSRSDIGCYSMVWQFVLLPISFVGSAISKVYYRKVSEVSGNSQELTNVTLQVCKITILICMFPALFLVCGGDVLLVYVLGPQWHTAGTMSLCMAISSIPIILTEALLPIYKTLNFQNIRFHYDALLFVLSLGGLTLGCIFTQNLYISIILYTCLYSIVRFGMFKNILKLTNIELFKIPKINIIIVILCYIGITFRLLLKFL